MALQIRLQDGEAPAEAIEFLVGRGLSRAESTEIVDRIVATSVHADRRKGAIWLGLAALCFALGSPFLWGLYEGVRGGHSGRGFGIAMQQAAGLPALLVGCGLWLTYRGARLLLRRSYAADPD